MSCGGLGDDDLAEMVELKYGIGTLGTLFLLLLFFLRDFFGASLLSTNPNFFTTETINHGPRYLTTINHLC